MGVINVYNAGDSIVRQRVVPYTQAHIGTYTLVYTQVPMVSPLRTNALFQIFIKLIMSSYITLVPYLHNAFDSYFVSVYLFA